MRHRLLAEPGTVVVKVGTNVLANAEGVLDRDRIASLAHQLHAVRERGWRVVLVSSGAIGAGAPGASMIRDPRLDEYLRAYREGRLSLPESAIGARPVDSPQPRR